MKLSGTRGRVATPLGAIVGRLRLTRRTRSLTLALDSETSTVVRHRHSTVREPVRSLAEITELERAYALGAPTLGRAAAALVARWRWPLRDAETFLRLAFLAWYQEHEPGWLTGLDAPLPDVDALIADVGGEGALGAEARFTLAVLWSVFPPLGADEAAYAGRARAWAAAAADAEPASRLFAAWSFVVGDGEDMAGARMYVETEVHARYAGRGAMGDYLVHTLSSRLRPGAVQRGAV